jgi:hypothetical protein
MNVSFQIRSNSCIFLPFDDISLTTESVVEGLRKKKDKGSVISERK